MTKRRANPEELLQRSVAELLGRVLPREVWFTAFPAGGGGKVRGARLKAAGLQAGVPDIMLIFQGIVYFIELKSARGTESAPQRETARALLACGCRHRAVCRSLPEVIGTLRGWGIPMLDVRVAA